MYKVLCDNFPLYDLRDDNLILISPKIELEENNAGAFEFTISPTHPYYDSIKKMKSIIQIMDNEEEIFNGRVIDETTDFYNKKTIICEGELAFFNDSVQRPAVYHNQSVRGYLQTLINIHNAQIAELNLGIKFNSNCAGESATWDYASLYYVKGGQIYSAFTKKKANDLADKTFVIPSTEFYLYWHTDASVNNFFGIAVDSVTITNATAIVGSEATLPNYVPQTVTNVTDIQTAHNPYMHNSNIIWHYAHTIPDNLTVGKMFALGSVTVVDSNDSLYKYTNWETTMEVIKTDLLDTYGGHLRIRKVNGIRYLDYLQDYPNTNTQVIRFGENLLDFTKGIDATEIATAVIPLGARQEENEIQGLESRLTIKSVNNDVDFVYSESAVNTYGWIYKTVTFDDVNVPANLKIKGEQYLSDIQFENVTLEVQAVDLHMMDINVERIKMLDEIRVVSEPNGLDRFFPVTKMTIYLDTPSNNTITLGQTVSSGMTGSASSANSEIMKRIKEIPSTDSIVKQAVDNATALIHSALNGHVVITENANELLIMDTDDIKTARKLWRWNLNGLGYSSTGYDGTYATAITMDGQILGERLVGGSVTAEKLDVSYRTSVETKISTAQNNAENYTDDCLKSYWTKTETETAIKNTGDSVLLSAKQTATAYTDNKLKDYSTSAQIKVTTDAITSQVNAKLNKSDFSTTLQQNAYSLKIAWNKITNYIQIEYGEFNIYDYNDDLLMSLHPYGQSFYVNNDLIGMLGTSHWEELPDYHGLVFNLEEDAGWMSWSVWDRSYGYYATKLAYHNSNATGYEEGLHFECPTYTWGNLYINEDSQIVWLNKRDCGIATSGMFYICDNSSRHNASVGISSNEFKIYNNVSIDFYSSLNMHGYSIRNESDSRLKTNIKDVSVNAIDILKKIELKSFDWIANGSHVDVGIIAQQLEKVIPDLVITNEKTDIKSITFIELIPYLIKAIQELSEQINPSIQLASYDANESESHWVDDMNYIDKKAFTIQNAPKNVAPIITHKKPSKTYKIKKRKD